MNDMAKPMLKIDDINVYYGAIHALKGISLDEDEARRLRYILDNIDFGTL